MLDKTTFAAGFSADEQEIFAKARAAGQCLQRQGFDQWIQIGAAVQLAKKRADLAGVGNKTRGEQRRESANTPRVPPRDVSG